MAGFAEEQDEPHHSLCPLPVSVLSNPRVKTQRFCSDKACQRARKAQWQRDKLATDPDYRANQRDCQYRWQHQHPQYCASIANSVRITVNATGFYSSTGTTSTESIRLQRWMR